MADAQDALLRVCRHESGAGPQASYELRGPRRQEGGVCAFDAIAVATPAIPARELLANLRRTHMVYMRTATAACPPQDDPSYTQTQAQFGVGFAEQFLWAMRSLGRLRVTPEDFAAQLSKSPAFTAMLLRNRALPLRVIRMTAEEPSLRTVLNEPRVTLSIEAPEDPAPMPGAIYTLTIEPELGGFDIIEAGTAR